ncbi:MAG: ABC transporter permease [Candidatus Omnitrophota bacterium]|jgi:ABC-type antimicrobial peptide transport system permease subunit|nr:MAG: ABC transporter permease [Candidatus Omnitrophota bacterium]
MTILKLSLNNLSHYWKTHVGVICGVAVAAMVLTGSLIVGDCVKFTLHAIAVDRLGEIHFALSHQSRFFREQLAVDLEKELAAPVAPVFHVRGIVRKDGGGESANHVSVYGVNETFRQLSATPLPNGNENRDGLWINRKLAERLGVGEGDIVIVRIENPSAVSREVPLSTVEDTSIAFRIPISAILADNQLGRFDLRANQTPPDNAFLPLSLLQEKTERLQKINMLLIGQQRANPLAVEQVNDALHKIWRIEDAQLELQKLAHSDFTELRTERIFIEPSIKAGIDRCFATYAPENHPIGILTYFVDEIRLGSKTTPYSMATAIADNPLSRSRYPALNNLRDNEIILNEWAGEDLGAREGDSVTLTYNILGPMRKLITQEHTVVVKAIVPMTDPLCDAEMMPDFPGISKSEHCRDWDPGFVIDLDKIRDKDEDYWDQYRGTPKAFITLQTGQRLWSNRYGNLTTIRWIDPQQTSTDIATQLASHLNPAALGLSFLAVREQALQAVTQAMSFSPLFIGLSFFLIAAALILTMLLFVFGLEQRSREIGVLYALGFTRRQVRKLFVCEGVLLAGIGSLCGALAAILYSRLMIWALTTVWKGAVSAIPFHLAILPSTLVAGFAGGIAVTVVAIWFGIRNVSNEPIGFLLAAKGFYNLDLLQKMKTPHRGRWIAGGSLLIGVLLFLFVPDENAVQTAGKFFGVGAFLLIAALAFCQTILVRMSDRSTESHLTLWELGIRNNTRRRTRSLSIIGLLACGCFLMIAVGANRHDALSNADSRSSGTGGFAFVGETTLPLLHDLHTESGCNHFGLSREEVAQLQVVPLRLREGDDASCLNLNRAQNPKVIGVDPSAFAQRKSFQFVKTINGTIETENAWLLLNEKLPDNVVPAIADQSTIVWALGKSLGDTIEYKDDQGNSFQVKLVGALSNSILQGSLLIAEDNFIQRFPSANGYLFLLLDIPPSQRQDYREILTGALRDIGLELTPTGERLAAFFAVENTYLSIFQILGGFGLILGCVGLGVVVLRNLWERRSEIAVMKAVGFSNSSILRMILVEHLFLLGFGLACGLVSGLLAIFPAVTSRMHDLPYYSISITLIVMFLVGMFWIYVSAQLAVRERILDAIRSE